jgi:hypothetical protein
MLNDEAEQTLNEMLTAAGVDFDQPDPALVWRVFKDFSRIPVDCAEDGILFQCGVYAFSGTEQFHFDFTRQFTIEEDGEYDHMEQLQCTLLAPPTDELRACKANLWSFDSPTLDAYFERVEAMPEFQLGIGRQGYRLDVTQDSV